MNSEALIGSVFLQILLPQRNTAFQFETISGISFLQRVADGGFVGHFATGRDDIQPVLLFAQPARPFVGLAYGSAEIASRIHFKRQILVTGRHVFRGLGKHAIVFLTAEIRDFNATFVGHGGFAQEFPIRQRDVIGGERTAVHTGFDAFRVMACVFDETI